MGGPIIQDKLFFFFDSEWVRIALPIVTATTVPTPAFQNYVLQQLSHTATTNLAQNAVTRTVCLTGWDGMALLRMLRRSLQTVNQAGVPAASVQKFTLRNVFWPPCSTFRVRTGQNHRILREIPA